MKLYVPIKEARFYYAFFFLMAILIAFGVEDGKPPVFCVLPQLIGITLIFTLKRTKPSVITSLFITPFVVPAVLSSIFPQMPESIGYVIMVVVAGIFIVSIYRGETKKDFIKDFFQNPCPPQPIQPNYKPGDEITTYVAGVTFEGRQEVIQTLSCDNLVILKREPDNHYDKNAIHIQNELGQSIGYIKRELAEKIAPVIDRVTNELITGRVADITNPGTNNMGVKIQFQIPVIVPPPNRCGNFGSEMVTIPVRENREKKGGANLGVWITIAILLIIVVGLILAYGMAQQISNTTLQPTSIPTSTRVEATAPVYYIAVPPENARLVGNDKDIENESRSTAIEMAKILELPNDYRWEAYSLTNSTNQTIYNHYYNALKYRGYLTVSNENLGNGYYYFEFQFGDVHIAICYFESEQQMILFNWEATEKALSSRPLSSSLFTPPAGATFVASKENSNQSFKDSVAIHARNLAVPSGYDWEYYDLPADTHYVDIENYFTKLLTTIGYKKLISDQGTNEVYLLKFKSSSDHVIVQFWGDSKEILVFKY